MRDGYKSITPSQAIGTDVIEVDGMTLIVANAEKLGLIVRTAGGITLLGASLGKN